MQKYTQTLRIYLTYQNCSNVCTRKTLFNSKLNWAPLGQHSRLDRLWSQINFRQASIEGLMATHYPLKLYNQTDIVPKKIILIVLTFDMNQKTGQKMA